MAKLKKRYSKVLLPFKKTFADICDLLTHYKMVGQSHGAITPTRSQMRHFPPWIPPKKKLNSDLINSNEAAKSGEASKKERKDVRHKLTFGSTLQF